jgi:GT2 family glycosyltransferase
MMNCFSDETPFLSVIIPGYNRYNYLKEVVDSIHETADFPFELLIHDDGSVDGTTEYLPNLNCKVSTFILNQGLNMGLSESINRLVRLAGSKYILMLNADVKVMHNIFQDIFNVLHKPYVGHINFGPPLCNVPHELNSNGTRFALLRGMGQGCALAFRKNVWDCVGGWNNKTVASSNADVSFMVRVIRNGYFPVVFVKDTAALSVCNVSMERCKNSDSTIAGTPADCSFPKLFNSLTYRQDSRKRYEAAANAMQITYKEPEGEVNLHYWHTFMTQLITEDYRVNWEEAKRYGHIVWKDLIENA